MPKYGSGDALEKLQLNDASSFSFELRRQLRGFDLMWIRGLLHLEIIQNRF